MNYQDCATRETGEVLSALKSGPDGLTDAAAAANLALAGSNRLPRPRRAGWKIFFRQIRSPMSYVLGAAFLISFVVSDLTSGFTILAFLLVNVFLGFVQEYRSERIVSKLERFIAPTALAKRGGKWRRLPHEELVPGDVVALEPGDAFPADCRIIRAENLTVDESALTGESAPVAKESKALAKAPAAPFDAANAGFAGTIVVTGQAEAAIIATGGDTVFGRIAVKSAAARRPSVFERNLASFSRFLVWLVAIVLAAVYAANLVLKGDQADPVALLLFALAVAVSVIPEALPAVMTITFSKGALLLARKKVVVKRLSAIEDLGHVQVLCTDKTGTITENKLAVGRLSCADANACLLSALHSSERLEGKKQAVSSFDAAVWKFASADLHRRAESSPAVYALPFDPARRRNAAVVERGNKRYLAIKGAPEDVLELCGTAGKEREKVLAEFRAMGEEGMRVLAVAEREVGNKDEYGPEDERGAQFLGLIGFVDPLKPTARQAIKRAEELNVRVKMITGDSLEVAVATGIKAGIIASREGAIAGPELAALDEDAFAAAAERCDVFARIAPELKYRLVRTLESKYAVGFLGEGVNDAPALKAANVAIVVKEASDVAREAADVVLLERSLSVMIDGIREGRAIFANVSKYIRCTLVGNLGNFFSISLVSLFVDYLPLLPVQILLVNLLTDVPFVAIATDRVDDEQLASPHHLSIGGLALYCSILGFIASLFDFLFFAVFRAAPVGEIRTLWFVMSILTEVATVFVLRSNRFFLSARRPAWLLSGISFAVVALGLSLPFTALGRDVFSLIPPPWIGLAGVFALVAIYMAATEAGKLAYLRFARRILPERA